jgi:hypothetical protein
VDHDGVLVTGYHLPCLQVGGRMRWAAEAGIIAGATVPAFESDPRRRDDTCRIDQLGFQRTEFASFADEGLNGCFRYNPCHFSSCLEI